MSFEDDSYRVIKGDVNDKLLLELDSEIKEKETINQMVSVALEFINAYEKRDSSSTEIGNMIELHIAFSKTGILGSSNNKFVIFDTPGSNMATNDGHIEVLKELLYLRRFHNELVLDRLKIIPGDIQIGKHQLWQQPDSILLAQYQ